MASRDKAPWQDADRFVIAHTKNGYDILERIGRHFSLVRSFRQVDYIGSFGDGEVIDDFQWEAADEMCWVDAVVLLEAFNQHSFSDYEPCPSCSGAGHRIEALGSVNGHTALKTIQCDCAKDSGVLGGGLILRPGRGSDE